MQLTQAQIQQFERDGYLFFPSLFKPEEINVLTAGARIYARHIRNVREGSAAHQHGAPVQLPVRQAGAHPAWSPPRCRYSAKSSTASVQINGKMAFDGDV